ncbi:hypothetical protein AMECASPLE_009300 [Ameca splendens]|uniref:Uncharacterized protein n=1 Tax=Ameca splendens TaxID=208324 RepID=A0ABV0YY57_9TELE
MYKTDHSASQHHMPHILVPVCNLILIFILFPIAIVHFNEICPPVSPGFFLQNHSSSLDTLSCTFSRSKKNTMQLPLTFSINIKANIACVVFFLGIKLYCSSQMLTPDLSLACTTYP